MSSKDLTERAQTLKRIGKVFQSVSAQHEAQAGPRRVLSQTQPGGPPAAAQAPAAQPAAV